MIEAHGLWEFVEERARQTPDARFAVDASGLAVSFGEYKIAAE